MHYNIVTVNDGVGESVAPLDLMAVIPVESDVSEDAALDNQSPSVCVPIPEENQRKYEEEIRKLYKQLDDKVRAHTLTLTHTHSQTACS